MFVGLKITAAYFFSFIKSTMPYFFEAPGTAVRLSSADAARYLGQAVAGILIMAGPFLLISCVAGLALGGAQTRFLFAPERIKFKLSRMNPISGLKNLVSLRSLTELIKSVAKTAVIAVILYVELSSRIGEVMRLPFGDVTQSLCWTADAIFSIAIKICVLMAGLGILDFFYQRWEYERSLRMTKQEVKDEHKSLEGDPRVKGRVRQIQRKMASMRMMQRVKKADVVVRNPTHYAVALQYESERSKAPVVVAKGADHVALNIIEAAEKSRVSVIENRPLARGLYETVEIGGEIPEQYYQAVAEVLAFVYNLKKRSRAV